MKTRRTTTQPLRTSPAPTHKGTAPVAPLTILELGQCIAPLEAAYHANDLSALDQDKCTHGDEAAALHREKMGLIYERIWALRNLICTMPARSMADAAVQINVAASIACRVSGSKGRTGDEIEAMGQALENIAYSILPIVADAAGLDPKLMEWEGSIELRARRFPDAGRSA